MAILALLSSFVFLKLNRGPGQEEMTETGRRLSQYLRAVASEASESGSALMVKVDLEKGRFSHTDDNGNSGSLRRVVFPEGVSLSQLKGAEGSEYDLSEEFLEIEVPSDGLRESLQFTLNHRDLNDVILTWKLKGRICSVEVEEEGRESEHWKDELVRF